MNASTGRTRLRQAVGNFDDANSLHDVVQVLIDQGVAASDLTILVGQMSLDARFLPHIRRNPKMALDGLLSAMRTVGATKGAGPLLVSSTPFGDRLVATADDLAKSPQPLLTRWLSARHAGYLHQQLNRGAALLCIHVRNGEEEMRAGRALLQHSRHQVQMHDFSF